jgi:ribonuclease HI
MTSEDLTAKANFFAKEVRPPHPQPALIEAWFDGCCEPRNPGGHAAWGALVQLDGTTVYAEGGYCGFGPRMSNNVAEYSAFCAAAEECLKYPGVVFIRGDSKLVVMQLQGKWKVNGGLYKPFYDKAKPLWNQLKNRSKLEWIPREENDECDYLSKKVLKDMGIKFVLQPETNP